MFPERTFPQLMRRRAAESPERVLVSFKGRDYTYGEVYRVSCSVAKALQDLGLEKGDHVVVAMPNIPEVIMAFTAVSLVGAVFIPTNPNLTEREISYLLQNSRAKGLITADGFLQRASRVTSPDLQFTICARGEWEETGAIPWERVAATAADDFTEETPSPQETFMIIYTSGTTGDPKGVMLTHWGFLDNVNCICDLLHLTPEYVSINMLPYTHLFAPVMEWGPALASGGRFVLREGFNPRSVLEDLETYKGTFLAGVPAMYATILDEMKAHSHDVRSLRIGVVAAAPVPLHMQQEFEALTGCTMIQAYGQSETLLATMEPPERPLGLHPGTCGTIVFDGIEIRLVDEDGREVPQGEIGEFLVNTPAGMLGYWNMPEATASTIVDGWIHTGDLGYVDADGYYYVVDRLRHMIISSGRNIYPAEIESVLLALPQVREAAVIGLPDELRGESAEAFLVLKEGAKLLEREALQHCKENLADYKIPRKFHIVESFPHTISGKIRKVQFREDYIRASQAG